MDHPPVRRFFPPAEAETPSRLCEEREVFLAALDRLPRTFCHHDAFRRNLFARGSADGGHHTVAIDWAFAGTGVIGDELLCPVIMTVGFFAVELEKLQVSDATVFDGYLSGFREASLRGETPEVRLRFAAGTIRYALGIIPVHSVVFRSEERYAFWERALGRPLEDIMDDVSQERRFILSLLLEARELLDSV